jgi:hypothetical protein
MHVGSDGRDGGWIERGLANPEPDEGAARALSLSKPAK